MPAILHRLSLSYVAGLLVAGCATLFVGDPAKAQVASEPVSIAIVFDASGSMWGNLPGARLPKHALAREALRGALTRSAGKARVGLAIFGGQGRDCAGADLIAPLAPYSEAALLPALDRLNPRGRGPLVLALENAAAALADAPGHRSIVVVHDGSDNCNRDACEAIARLATAQPGLVVHTVGIALKDDERDTLACVVDRTGGKRFTADTPEDVTRSLALALELASLATRGATAAKPAASRSTPAQTAVPQSTAQRETPTAPPGSLLSAGITTVPGPTQLVLQAVVASPGIALEQGLSWSVYPLDGGTASGARQSTAAANRLQLAPGHYRIDATAGLVKRSLDVTLTEGQITRAVVDLAAGSLTAVVGLGVAPSPPAPGAFVTIRTLDGGAAEPPLYNGTVPTSPLIIAPGRYAITVRAGLVSHRQTLEIERAREVRLELALAAAEIDISLKTGDERLDDPPVLLIARDEPGSSAEQPILLRTAAPSSRVVLPAGSYTLTALAGAISTRQLITVQPGERVSRTLDLSTGRIEARVMLGGTPLKSEAIQLSITPRQTALGAAPRSVSVNKVVAGLSVAPGGYTIEARVAGHPVSVATTTLVAPGTRRTIDLELPAAEVTIVPPQVPPSARDITPFIEIRNSAGALVWKAIGSAPRPALLAPGSYVIRSLAGIAVRESRIAVAAGQRIVVDFGR